MYYSTTHPSPIGNLTLASDGKNLIGLWMDGQKYHGNTIFKDMIVKNNLSVFDNTKEWLDKYFSKQKPSIFQLPITPIGSRFRQEVWKILCEIPYGEVVTYGDIAKEVSVKLNKDKMSGQAVGGAVGHNPISIIIPCHRVVGSKGSLTGYSAGVKIKMKLLQLECANITGLSVPIKGTAL